MNTVEYSYNPQSGLLRSVVTYHTKKINEAIDDEVVKALAEAARQSIYEIPEFRTTIQEAIKAAIPMLGMEAMINLIREEVAKGLKSK